MGFAGRHPGGNRSGAVSVLEYQDQGFLPDALLNYLVRLGWSHGDQEFFTRAEMVADFDVRDINKAASAINPEKLLWLNQQHMMRAAPADLVPYLRAQLRGLGCDSSDRSLLEGVILAQRERAKTMKEMAHNSRFFFVELLASYTHVVSGSTWTATRRGWRRRRFSELDPVQLAGLLGVVDLQEDGEQVAPALAAVDEDLVGGGLLEQLDQLLVVLVLH